MCSDLGIRRVESCVSLTLSDRDAPQRTRAVGRLWDGRRTTPAGGIGLQMQAASPSVARYRRMGRARPDVPEPEPSDVVAIGPLAVRGEPLVAVDHPRVAARAELDLRGSGQLRRAFSITSCGRGSSGAPRADERCADFYLDGDEPLSTSGWRQRRSLRRQHPPGHAELIARHSRALWLGLRQWGIGG